MPGILPPSDDTRVLNNPTVLMGCLAVGAGVGYWVGLDKDDDISPAMGAVYGAGFMLALILLNEMF